MPNIIVNNYCNQSCSYCFANENMKNKKLQKNMNLITYIRILKYLNLNNLNEIRILGGEPLLFPNIRKFLKIANKGNFDIIVFSNINLKNEKIEYIFKGIKNVRLNCNINDEDFYKRQELENINKNLEIVKSLGTNLIIGYNIIDTEKNNKFIFNLAKKNNIRNINLKITNSSLGDKILINNSDRKLGIYIFDTIKKYHKNFNIEFSCGLDKNIFKKEELNFIEEKTNIKLKFGCEGNIGKLDINTDGSIFKCYPLYNLFKNKKMNVKDLLENKISIEKTLEKINKGLWSNGECSANKKNKW